jgi:DNA-binding MarR family transcriptional regulator
MQRTSYTGLIFATSRRTGLPSVLAQRSQTALTTAPVARCMAPLFGPIQRAVNGHDRALFLVRKGSFASADSLLSGAKFVDTETFNTDRELSLDEGTSAKLEERVNALSGQLRSEGRSSVRATTTTPYPPQASEPDPDLGELPNVLGLLLRLAQIRQHDQFFAAFHGSDARPGELTVLWVIDLNPGIKQGVVARLLSIKPAHMTKLIQRLIDGGRVDRTIPLEDRRSVRLTLTPAGKDYLDRHRDTYRLVHTAANTGLTADEFAALVTILRKLAF